MYQFPPAIGDDTTLHRDSRRQQNRRQPSQHNGAASRYETRTQPRAGDQATHLPCPEAAA